nr:zinc finger BED domain-containing protein RICESLEEPER 2-like [Ipomoea batatas]
MISLLKTKLNKLFSAYANIITPRPSQPQVTSSSMQSESLGKTKGKRAFEAIKKYDTRTVKTIGKSELEIYLEEPKLEYAYYEDLNILDYWKERMHRYPALALMAQDVLAIPITTVASESAFSIGARVLTKYRSCTLPEKVQALICTRNWLHGYAIDFSKRSGVDQEQDVCHSGKRKSLFGQLNSTIYHHGLGTKEAALAPNSVGAISTLGNNAAVHDGGEVEQCRGGEAKQWQRREEISIKY